MKKDAVLSPLTAAQKCVIIKGRKRLLVREFHFFVTVSVLYINR